MSHQQQYWIALRVILDTLGIHYAYQPGDKKFTSITLHDLRYEKMSSFTAVIDIFTPTSGHDFMIFEPGAVDHYVADLPELVRLLEKCGNLINQRFQK